MKKIWKNFIYKILPIPGRRFLWGKPLWFESLSWTGLMLGCSGPLTELPSVGPSTLRKNCSESWLSSPRGRSGGWKGGLLSNTIVHDTRYLNFFLDKSIYLHSSVCQTLVHLLSSDPCWKVAQLLLALLLKNVMQVKYYVKTTFTKYQTNTSALKILPARSPGGLDPSTSCFSSIGRPVGLTVDSAVRTKFNRCLNLCHN